MTRGAAAAAGDGKRKKERAGLNFRAPSKTHLSLSLSAYLWMRRQCGLLDAQLGKAGERLAPRQPAGQGGDRHGEGGAALVEGEGRAERRR